MQAISPSIDSETACLQALKDIDQQHGSWSQLHKILKP